LIFAQCSQALGNFGFVEPFDFILLATAYGLEAFRGHKLDSARTVFTNMRDERKNVAGRDLELRGPAGEHLFVVWQ
jgi:hypothetical protein